MKTCETEYIYCGHCGKAEVVEIDSSFGYAIRRLPVGWSNIGRELLCPICSEAYIENLKRG